MCHARLLVHFKRKRLVVLLYKSWQIIALFITNKMGEFRRGKILTCDRKPEVDLEQNSSEPGDLEKVT